jgi:hypothetical protein
MSIIEMYTDEDTDITEGLRRKDHVIFAGNEEGIYPDESVGFSLVNMIAEDHWTTLLGSAKGKVGDVVSWYDEAEYVWFHCVISYSVARGWEEEGYERITEALNKIWEEHEEDYVRPFRCTWIGRGKMRKHGQVEGNLVLAMQAMANSECRLAVYTRVPAY